MRCEQIEQKSEGPQFAAGDAARRGNIVHQGHQRRDGRVELEVLHILADLFDRLVERSFHLPADDVSVAKNVLQAPITLQKAPASPDAVCAPRSRLFEIADEHLIQTERIGAVFVHDVVRINHIAARLAHFLAVFTEDHTVARAFGVGLRRGNFADVVQEFMPETAVKQMKRGMLHAAVVPVHRQPVFHGFFSGKALAVVRIRVAQKIPRRTRPLRHGVRFPLGGAAAMRAGGVYPVRHVGERGLAVVRRFIGFHVRQAERKLALRNGDIAAFRADHDRDRLAPIALARENPVAKLEVDFRAADALLLQISDDLLFCVFNGKPVQDPGIYHNARRAVGVCFFLYVPAFDDFDDRQTEFFREVPVAGVVGRNGHDRSGPVGHEDVVGKENRNFFSGNRIDPVDSFQAYTRLFLGKLGALEI